MTRLRRIIIRGFLVAAALPLLFLFLSLLFPLPPMKPFSLVVEDRNGRFLQAFLAPDGAWRLRTSPDEIPRRLKEILLRREDRLFYVHPGVNPLAVLRALAQNIRSGRRVSGASTITMQIARMLHPGERTYLNKAVEVFRALQIEARYSKNEILEIYLSIVPLGGNVEGLRSAALLYYDTPLERLNIAQLFDLMLIPGDPNGLEPDRNAERLLSERRRQAALWIRQGLLSAADSVVIWNTPALAVRRALPRAAQHFALRIKELHPLAADVRSSLDLGIQHTVEDLLSNHLRPWKQRGVRNSAVLVVENGTREILAYAGSEDFSDASASGQVDAVRALRSPGSTLKPFLYAMQMDRGELTPRSRLLDTPYDAEGFLAEN
ncbi:MAG TPA: transglycosylase domain-containing protein, partial [Bacteroidota bacterium]|nr:transglycosylase domain-containing protein [Bacteroidota bacterium]